MNKKHIAVILSSVLVVVAATYYAVIYRAPARETIFDRIVSIPQQWVLDVPMLPPLCDDIKDLKKGVVDIAGGKLYYEEEGHGMPLVLLHGGPGGTHHYFHPWFSRLKDIARIIYYDQRGSGKSSIDATGKTYTVKQAVQDLAALRAALGIDRWAVLGYSYGGFLGQCYALTYPEHVMSLILVDSSDGLKNVQLKPGREDMFISPAEQKALVAIGAAKRAGTLTGEWARYNRCLAGDWKRQGYYKPTPAECVRQARYEWTTEPAFNRLINADADKIALDGTFADFEIPTLLMEAKWDLTWDTDKAQYMRKNHPHAQFAYFEKSGHGIFSDEPDKFFAVLRDFLQKSAQVKIIYKPGNRIAWPKPLSPLSAAATIALAEPPSDKQIARLDALYAQAVAQQEPDADFWPPFAWYFYKIKHDYPKALTCLQVWERAAKKDLATEWKKFGYGIKAWQGHMLDLLGKRAEAIACYQEALKANPPLEANTIFFDAEITKQWIEDRLKTPFKMPAAA